VKITFGVHLQPVGDLILRLRRWRLCLNHGH
jgi:hypothetical protein